MVTVWKKRVGWWKETYRSVPSSYLIRASTLMASFFPITYSTHHHCPCVRCTQRPMRWKLVQWGLRFSVRRLSSYCSLDHASLSLPFHLAHKLSQAPLSFCIILLHYPATVSEHLYKRTQNRFAYTCGRSSFSRSISLSISSIRFLYLPTLKIASYGKQMPTGIKVDVKICFVVV
ncbi:hypothetical protein M404DRAFT_778612 [Pisolithus tinctorius Marx 270]|uniref:Uncharacterized protein n=1 Tax=Pisolithus tinctorius Marx 270 TaxID=870435 RepID=A0A0C3ISC3_PISTI|nr:hypothetical protein M404DRAFT_778612 [Pisolithus tinctorius Marx 270]